MIEERNGFIRTKPRQAANVIVDLCVTESHPALRIGRCADASGRAREIDHGTVFRAERFDRRISRTRAQRTCGSAQGIQRSLPARAEVDPRNGLGVFA